MERAAALACCLQALCRYLLAFDEPPPREDHYLVYHYKRFQACRFGLDGTLVHPQRHEPAVLRDDILATLRRLEPHVEALDCTPALELLRKEAQAGSDADYLRGAWNAGGSREAVVDAALRRFRQEQTACV